MAKQNCFTKIAVSLAFAASDGDVCAAAVGCANGRPPRRPQQKTPARATTANGHREEESLFRHPPRAPAARSWRAPAPPPARASSASCRRRGSRVDEFGREVPDVRAEAAIIYNPETGEVLWENHSKDQRSIASITKVMTALVFLESGAPLDQMVTVQRSDVVARLDHVSPQRLQAHRRRSAEPAAGRVRQRRGPRAGARLADGLRRLHRADERERAGARAREHGLRGSLGPARRERVVGLRSGAADRLCRRGRARRRDHAQDVVTRPTSASA